MNLSEKLNLNYCDTTVLTKEIAEHNKQCTEYAKNYDHSKLNIWQTVDSPYYVIMKKIKEKQDAGEIVTDAEYKALPISGNPGYWSVAYYYYTINFHYNFHHAGLINKTSLLYKFMDFIAVVDFTECRESEVMNISSGFRTFIYSFKSATPAIKDTCNFIIQILDAIDPIKNNNIGALLNIDRSIAPDVFDNAIRYFRMKGNKLNKIIENNKDKVSFKASEVMTLLDITRPTLCKYVKQGLIVIDTVINGQYRYNKDSVYNLIK